MKKRDLGLIAAGALAGAAAGVLLTPKSGKENREELKNKMGELLDKVKNINSNDVKNKFNKKIKEIEKEIKSLDKEQVIEIAKKKSEDIKTKVNDLVSLAKEKGDESLEKTTKELKEKAINVTKDVLNKLENSNNKE